jgi:putative addiction module component (TIGR02574 family)
MVWNENVKQNIVEILKEALKLPPEARAALAGTLLDSLDEIVDRDAESAWEAEIVMRLKEIDEGKVNLIPWAEARARIAGQ